MQNKVNLMTDNALAATVTRSSSAMLLIGSLVQINSLTPGKLEWHFRYVMFFRYVIGGWGISCEIALILMSLDQPTLVQVMAWCRQATSPYLSQCWSRSMSPYCVTRPEWVNSLNPIRHHRTLSTMVQITACCLMKQFYALQVMDTKAAHKFFINFSRTLETSFSTRNVNRMNALATETERTKKIIVSVILRYTDKETKS